LILDEETEQMIESSAEGILTGLEAITSGNIMLGLLFGFGIGELMGLLRLL